MKKVKLLVLLSLLLCFSSSAFALQTTFYGYDDGGKITTNSNIARNAFFSNLQGVGTETFETYTDGTTGPLTVNFGSAGSATLSGMGAIQEGDSTGRWAISGTKYWEAPGSSSSLFTITFTEKIAAFGFYGTDIGDFEGQVTVTTANGTSTTYIIPHPTGQGNYDYTALYWGVIDTVNPFTSITFANTGSGADYFGFDDFSIGTIEQVHPTPEPATMLLLGLGLVGLTTLRKKF